jgi:hypothetical protein
MNKRIEADVTTAIIIMKALHVKSELIVALLRAGRVRHGKPYIRLFDFDQNRDYVKTLGLSQEIAPGVEELLIKLRQMNIDNLVLINNREEVLPDHEITTSATVDYDVVRAYNQAGINVTLTFSLSDCDDDEAEGPMRDIYYEFDTLIIQGT